MPVHPRQHKAGVSFDIPAREVKSPEARRIDELEEELTTLRADFKKLSAVVETLRSKMSCQLNPY
jgi:hypothetical protein